MSDGDQTRILRERRDHIAAIQNECFAPNGRIRKGYSNALDKIAREIYRTKEHFVFELIQNADDNIYDKGVVPSLAFSVKRPTGTSGLCLIVTNNECGFTPDNVEGICSVGETTKTDKRIYIGEKGIGFKSVFNVTHCPQIHSNGYHFRLPDKEHDTEAKLGFVVPYWVDPIPEGLSSEGTTILLPLKADCTEMICKHLKGFSPETIIFLRKLKNIEIDLDVGEYHANVEIERKRNKIKDREISLTVLRGTEVPTNRYWMARKRYKVELADIPDERSSITHREVTVALPLDETEKYSGKLFAYLPVDEHTGMPFLVNADFLLTANRGQLKEKTPWNDWLMNCIAPVYERAFVTGIRSRMLIEDKARLYSSLPCNDNRYSTVSKQIKERLKETKCVLTVSGNAELPERCRRFKPEHKVWRHLLTDGGDAPTVLTSGFMTVHQLIEGYGSQLKYLGVPLFEEADIYESLQDAEWVGRRPIEWFVRLYQELDAKFGDMRALPILPVVMFDGGQQTCRCADGLHIYRRLIEEDSNEIAAFPQWARERMPIASFAPGLLDRVDALPEEARKKIHELFKVIGIKEAFSIDEYASLVVKTLGAKTTELQRDQAFELTDYLLKMERKIDNWSDLPVVLGNGSIMRASDVQKSSPSGLVVPETNDAEAGWQHIWQKPNDRTHFLWLADWYSNKPILRKLHVSRYPQFMRKEIRKDDAALTPMELKALKLTRDTVRANWKDAYIETCVVPAFDLSPLAGDALVNWLMYGEIDLRDARKSKIDIVGWYINKGSYEYKSRRAPSFLMSFERQTLSPVIEWLKTHAWLPTTQGLRKPSEAYLDKPSIREIFGDRLAYFQGRLQEGTISCLGITSDISTFGLIEELKKQVGRPDADSELIRKIYKQLENRDSSLKQHFAEASLIAIGRGEEGITWHSVSECVWEDASDSAVDKFCYLEKRYPELKSFFVNVLGVRERVCADLYLDRLATLSRQCAQKFEEIGLIYQHLDKYEQNEVSPERFEREQLIAAKSSDGSLRWHRLSECVWEAESVFADMFGCLKQDHPELKSFFCSRLKVRQRLELKDYLDCWVKLQEPSADPLAPHRKRIVESLYREIGLCLDRIDSEPFTNFFSKKPRVYTDKYVFRSGTEVYWPDDGQLKEELSDVEYAWLPDQETYEQWKGFLDKMCVSLLSKCVRVEMLERPCAPAADANRYLTAEAVQLMATCIREKHANAYQRLLREGKFEQLVGTREVNVESSLKVRYTIASRGKTAESPVYWDSQKGLLYVNREDPKTLKRKIATHLALSLIDKSYDSDFENYLEEDNLDRLKDKSWKVPSEISALFGSATPCHTEDQQMVAPVQPAFAPALQAPEAVASQPMAAPHSAVATRQSSGIPQPASVSPAPVPHPHPSVSVSPHRSASRDTPVAKPEPADRPAFNPFEDSPGVEALEESDDEEIPSVIRHPEYFKRVVTADVKARLAAEPTPDERLRQVDSVQLECADSQVRAKLLEYYGGKCQMCHKTFPKRDGEQYFVAAHYVRRKDGRYLDCVDNAICLCAEHFAKWQHAARVFEKESTKRILVIGPNADDSVIRVRLAGIDETITYVPAHLAKLQALYREAGPCQEPTSANEG